MTYEELKDLVKHHSYLYYDANRPVISDEEFDQLYDQLLIMEKHQGWKSSDSPTVKVGGQSGKIKHPHQLYSLKKVYNLEEVPSEFDITTPKIDGANLTLIYKKGLLTLALTRGDGEKGESVTHLASHINGVPTDISTKNDFYINGECVTDNTVDNFRNYVSGSLSLLSPEEFKLRNIRFIAHDILGVSMNYISKMKILKEMGFTSVFDEEECDKYPQDGKVYRINDWKTCERLGYTSKYPRFAVALKERNALTAITVLKEVSWAIGRTGTVNPTGIVEPVILDGATVSRVTLHNLDFILENSLGLGDIIEIERAGGVIPKFTRVVTHSDHNLKINQQSAERAVGKKLKKEGPKLYCINEGEYNSEKLLEYFVKTLEIKGLGPSSIKKMGLTHPIDIYSEKNWSYLGANGAKIVEEVERSKTKPYEVVLASLGIPGVGKSVAKKISHYLPSFKQLRDIENINIPGIADKSKDKILLWLDNNEDWVYTLPLQLKQEQTVSSVVNKSKKVCITGKMDMTRNELSEHLSQLGYEVVNSVTKKCNILISGGDTSSSKYKKAVEYGIEILDYWKHKNDILKGQF